MRCSGEVSGSGTKACDSQVMSYKSQFMKIHVVAERKGTN